MNMKHNNVTNASIVEHSRNSHRNNKMKIKLEKNDEENEEKVVAKKQKNLAIKIFKCRHGVAIDKQFILLSL